MAGGSKKLTKKEELLLQDFSRNVSTKSSALFYGNAFIVSAIPICKFDSDVAVIMCDYIQLASDGPFASTQLPTWHVWLETLIQAELLSLSFKFEPNENKKITASLYIKSISISSV